MYRLSVNPGIDRVVDFIESKPFTYSYPRSYPFSFQLLQCGQERESR